MQDFTASDWVPAEVLINQTQEFGMLFQMLFRIFSNNIDKFLAMPQGS